MSKSRSNLDDLAGVEADLLAMLPIEPTGLSLDELAEGLLDNRGPAGRGRTKRALEAVADALGGLHVARGDDDLGHADVPLYGIRRQDFERVRHSCGMKMTKGHVYR